MCVNLGVLISFRKAGLELFEVVSRKLSLIWRILCSLSISRFALLDSIGLA